MPQSLLQDLLVGKEKPDLLIFLSNSTPLIPKLFEQFYATLGGKLISFEGKLESNPNPNSTITFIDSLFFLSFTTRQSDLYDCLSNSKPIYTLITESLFEVLDAKIIDQLNRTASWISIENVNDTKGERNTSVIKLKLLKRNGKIIEQFYNSSTLEPIIEKKKSSTNTYLYKDLSFNVGLSQRQLEAKDSLHLPYWNAQEGLVSNEPVISYFHDKMDDFDEDDPDADLEF